VSRIITDLAVFDCVLEGLVLRELVPEVTVEELEKLTDAPFTVADDFKPYVV
jgi:acyl CoA:acetate/3-ketoacid CoA transferase beta subunit